ncbi:agamous-like MADS-box protein AGL103 [Durio zibethinus]|uniref:Agamous-like MADS-box protein AGL103 n=1 Tax=Durio zibethinus TaxID=66656 RepID=A0A6P6BAN5_DURZI|nr:agamous-like MADS-box protein AGL103 [Durio zibethinus]
MGRGKLSLKLIEHEKTRAGVFKKRMKGLKKKAYEFSILCDVKMCMIIFEPKLKDNPAKVEVWPSDPVQVNSIIDKYKSKVASDVQTKIFSIFDFFNMRKRQVHDEVAQVRKANLEAKFPTWDDRIDNFSPEQIATFLTKLDLNLEVVKRKIMLMKGDDQGHLMQSSKSRTLGGFNSQSRPNPSDYASAAFLPENLDHSDNHIQAHVPLEILNHFDQIQAFPEFPQKKLDFGVSREQQAHIPVKPLNIQLPSLSPADEALVKLSLSLNPIGNLMNPIDKSLRTSMMNNIDFRVQSGIASSSSSSSSSSIPNNVMYNPPPWFSVRHDPRIGMPSNSVMFNRPSIPVLDDPRSTAMQNNVMFKEPKAAFQTCFYTPSMQPELATYSRQQLIMPHLVPQMLPCEFTDFYHDFNEYEIKNKKQSYNSIQCLTSTLMFFGAKRLFGPIYVNLSPRLGYYLSKLDHVETTSINTEQID